MRGIAADPRARIALTAETGQEARDVMVEGASGLLSVHPNAERPERYPTLLRLEWRRGAVAQIFSAENYEGLRGPQFSAAWCDELAKWRHADEHAAINGWRSPREPLDAFASVEGFDGWANQGFYWLKHSACVHRRAATIPPMPVSRHYDQFFG